MKRLLTCTLATCFSVLPAVSGAQQVSFFADYLYMQPSEQTASIWASKSTDTAQKGFIFTPQNTNFDIARGIRAGVAFQPADNFWTTTLTWSYLPTREKASIRDGAQIILSNFFSGFLSRNFFFGADMDWQFAMHNVDLLMSHDIKLSPTLSISPFAGLKGSYIKQTIDSNWDAITFVSTENVQHKYYGIGPSLGFGAKLALFQNVSLIGNLQTAFLWGTWNVKDTYKRPSALFGVVTPTTITTSMKHSQLGTFMLDTIIGAEWQPTGKQNIAVKVGYEMQYWANQLRLITFQELPTHGDLTIQGATCGLYIDL